MVLWCQRVSELIRSNPIFTARIRRMREGSVLTLSTISGGGTPSQVCGWGVPHPRSVGGYPVPGLDGGGGYPSQVWMVGGTPARSGWWGVPQPDLDGGGYPPSQVWMGYDQVMSLLVGNNFKTPFHRQ